MTWEPNFEENECASSGLQTFYHYDQQENYGATSLRRKNATLDVDEDAYDDQIDVSTLTIDARAALEFDAYRRKLGYKKPETRQWDENRENSEDVEYEIAKAIRNAGVEPEPSLNYRPSSKTTSRSAIPTDKLPVPGVKNLFLSRDHFKFENPYFISKPNENKSDVDKEVTKKEVEVESPSTRETKSKLNSPSTTRRSSKEPTIGVAGEQYVSPAQLYALKARRNR